MPCHLSVKSFVNAALQMLHPGAHQKGLLFHSQTRFQQHPEGVPGAVSHCQHQLTGGNHLTCGFHPGKAAMMNPKSGKRGGKPHLSPIFQNLPPHGGHHLPQQIGADMGLGPMEGLLRCSMASELFQYIAAKRVADPGGQLSVRKGTGSSFAKLHIAVRFQFSLLPEPFYRLYPLLYRPSPFQHQRTIAVTGQHRSGKDTRRPQTCYHHRTRQRRRSPGNSKGLFLLEKDRAVLQRSR